MLKVTKSKMHKFEVLVIFQGLQIQPTQDQYLFKESLHLFSEDNLASTLVEYTSREELEKFLETDDYFELINEIKNGFSRKATIVEVSLGEARDGADLVLNYSPGGLRTVTVNALSYTLKEHLKLNAIVEENDVLSSKLLKPAFAEACHLQVIVSKFFVSDGCRQLSAKFSNFSSRYVDSQIPFTLIIPCLSGTAEKN